MPRFVVVALAVASVVVLAGSANAQPRIGAIGPDQAFAGVVNGSSANAVLRVVCPGPEGRTGHPVGGQAVEVAPSTATAEGFTGQAHRIAADIFFATPSSVVPPRLAVFRYYDDPVAISTSLFFPCSGTGRVVFSPVSGGKTGRSAVVHVTFVNVGAGLS